MTAIRGFAPPENVADLYRKKLDSSGLTLTDGNSLGMSHCSSADAVSLEIWFGYTPPTLLIPYTDPWGSKWDFLRGRALRDPPIIPKNYRKYGQRKGSPLRAYFPTLNTNWLSILKDPTKPLIFTEGELKAAKACKEGFPTIGLGGVWNFGGGKRGTQFIEELDRIEWQNRKVYIAYDSDAADKLPVQEARQALANRLIQRGAYVYDIIIPELKKGQKVGLDDYLLTEGANAFQTLIDDAAEIPFDWKYFYQIGATGPINNLTNIMVAMRHAPELEDVFAYDEMTCFPMVMEKLFRESDDITYPRRLGNNDLTRVHEWLQREGGLVRLGSESILPAITARAHENAFHPVHDYLNSLTWDKTPRLTNWLANAFGVEDNEYHRAISRMLLIAMCARVIRPGCKADYMVVLEGGQGELKSTACRILAGEWFSDNLPDVGKDEVRVAMHMRGKWLIEVAELGAMSKSEVEAVKKFVTRQSEQFVAKYAKMEGVEPRQCVLIATTNEFRYLKDETDNRRFWPVRTVKTDIKWLQANRDQLFAEAYQAFKADEHWWPEKALEDRVFKPEQAARFAGGEWDEDIWNYLVIAVKYLEEPEKYRISTNTIATSVLSIDLNRRTVETNRRIASALRRLGFEAGKSMGSWYFSPSQKLIEQLAAEKKAEDAAKKVAKAVRAGKVVPIKPTAKRG